MASPFHFGLCALVALICWTAVGLPLSRRLMGRELGMAFAPLIGWAAHCALALPLFFVVPFTGANVAIVAAFSISLSAAVAWIDGRYARPGSEFAHPPAAPTSPAVPVWGFALAALLALASAAAIAPKPVGDGIMLSTQIFDHAKVAMIADMARNGLPPGNPFFAHDGGTGRLAYYYLWHFSAAEISFLPGATAWDADICMTFFAAFASLSVMMGAAVRLSGRASASLWVVALSASASSRVVLLWLFGNAFVDDWFPVPGGFGGWLFQSSWVPQHLISTACVLTSIYLMDGLARQVRLLGIGALALTVAAAFESSTWVGGVAFALASVIIVPLMIAQTVPAQRHRFLAALTAVAVLSLMLSWHFLVDQSAASALRHGGSPVGLRIFSIFGDAMPESWRTVFDLPGYWLVLLPVEFTAVYATGLAVIAMLIRRRIDGQAPADRRLMAGYVALALMALLNGAFLASTLADNNDLGWRAGLLACTALIVLSGAGLAVWVAQGRWRAVALGGFALILGLPGAWQQINLNIQGEDKPAEGRLFANAPELWAAVRAHSGPAERVANNPLALRYMTPWPVNLSWALLADRRSCYPGWELAQVYTSVPHDQLRAVNTRFELLFAGEAVPGAVKDLAETYDCAVIALTAEDGAWVHDPFAGGEYYGLVEERAGHWRIYKRLARAR